MGDVAAGVPRCGGGAGSRSKSSSTAASTNDDIRRAELGHEADVEDIVVDESHRHLRHRATLAIAATATASRHLGRYFFEQLKHKPERRPCAQCQLCILTLTIGRKSDEPLHRWR